MPDVFISPSTYHFNKGYGTYGTEEQRANLIANVVEYELNRNGLSTSRNSPDQTLTEIVAQSNAENPSVHVAIQTQAGNGTQRGAEIYFYKPGTNGERLADDIFGYLRQVTPTEDLGIREGASVYGGQGFYELRRTRAPSVIVNVGFHDNPADAQFIIENIYEIGVAIAKGVLEYFGRTYTPDTPENIARMQRDYNNVYFS